MNAGGSLQRSVTGLAQSSYRAKILMFATLAALCPFLITVSLSRTNTLGAPPQWWQTPLLGLGVALLFLFTLARALRPIETVAKTLEGCAGAKAPPALSDDGARILANVETVAAKLDALNRRAANHPVTNLPMREDFLAAVGADIKALGDAPILLGLIRFANFEQIAAFDPLAAERALCAFAERIGQAVDKTRPLAHVDRESFAIWFRGIETRETASAELQAISYVLAQEIRDGELTIAPDVQIGAAFYPSDGDDAGNLLTRAFVSLARPQRSAAGGVAFYAPISPVDARRRFSLEQDLRQAIRRNQLTLHYQPIVDVAAGRVTGAEALLRWRHAELGVVSPSEFVPILEDSGLVHEIGLWTLNTACRQARAWRDAGVADFKVAVNLSALQLRDPGLKSVIVSTLERHGLSPQHLELELTETAAMEDAERTLALFHDLSQLGFGLAIDDFGAGYSSLSYLQKLPFNKLKIDREFVTHIDSRSTSRAICKALIELTAGLEISVLAEGVERREEVEELRRLGCAAFQGFYFARPLSADAFIDTINDPDWQALVASPAHREQAELRRHAS